MKLWDYTPKGKSTYLDVNPGAKPKYMRPYAVQKIHMDTFKKELDHLVEIDVLNE